MEAVDAPTRGGTFRADGVATDEGAGRTVGRAVLDVDGDGVGVHRGGVAVQVDQIVPGLVVDFVEIAQTGAPVADDIGGGADGDITTEARRRNPRSR